MVKIACYNPNYHRRKGCNHPSPFLHFDEIGSISVVVHSPTSNGNYLIKNFLMKHLIPVIFDMVIRNKKNKTELMENN